MKISKTLLVLSILIIVFSAAASVVGLFWQDGDSPFTFTSLRGQAVQMFGRGIYQNDSSFTAGTFVGTDAVTLFVCIPLFIVSIMLYNRSSLKSQLFHLGMLSFFLYNGASLALGAAYNSLFLVYIALFTSSLFAFGFAFNAIDLKTLPASISPRMPHRGLAVFMLVCGIALALVWLSELVGAMAQGQAPSTLGSYTTIVTDVLDLGIISPTLLLAGILILRRSPMGYPIAFTLLMLCTLIGIVVIAQTVTQMSIGIILPPGQMIGMVGSFVIMSLFAIWLMVLFLHNTLGRAANA